RLTFLSSLDLGSWIWINSGVLEAEAAISVIGLVAHGVVNGAETTENHIRAAARCRLSPGRWQALPVSEPQMPLSLDCENRVPIGFSVQGRQRSVRRLAASFQRTGASAFHNFRRPADIARPLVLARPPARRPRSSPMQNLVRPARRRRRRHPR